jgi:hypothetical protein
VRISLRRCTTTGVTRICTASRGAASRTKPSGAPSGIPTAVTEQHGCTWKRRLEFPTGFIAIGDSYCLFNIVYGQGVAIAALGARALRNLVRPTPARATFPRCLGHMVPLIRQIWDAAAANSRTGAPATDQARHLREYQLALFRAASRDAAVAKIVLGVSHLRRSSQELQAPEIPPPRVHVSLTLLTRLECRPTTLMCTGMISSCLRRDYSAELVQRQVAWGGARAFEKAHDHALNLSWREVC